MLNQEPENLTGFGIHTAKEVEELQKALTIGDEYATSTPGSLSGGAALAVEDLDRTLKLVTHGMEHLKLWKDIIKEKSSQTVHEFNIQNSYGQEVSPFFSMGGTPQNTDAGYNRDVAIVKYLGTQGSVQHNLTLIQAAHGPVVAREVKNKTIELLARNERSMFEADDAINDLEYEGIDAQIRRKQTESQYKSSAFEGFQQPGQEDSVVLDRAGRPLDEDTCEDSTLLAINNFGVPMDMYLSTDIHSRFSKAFYAKERVRPGDRTAAGYLVPEFVGSLNFRFKPDLFIRPRQQPRSSSVSAQSAPTLANGTSPADAASQFDASSAGSYAYKVSAVYSDGETLASSELVVAVSSGDNASIEVSYSGSPLYLNIFRDEKDVSGGTGHKFIRRIAPAGTGNAAVMDLNAKQPGLGSAYLLMHDPDTLVFRQLGSLIKYDLAVTDTSYKWLQLLYGMIVIQAPRKHVIIDNIGLS